MIHWIVASVKIQVYWNWHFDGSMASCAEWTDEINNTQKYWFPRNETSVVLHDQSIRSKQSNTRWCLKWKKMSAVLCWIDLVLASEKNCSPKCAAVISAGIMATYCWGSCLPLLRRCCTSWLYNAAQHWIIETAALGHEPAAMCNFRSAAAPSIRAPAGWPSEGINDFKSHWSHHCKSRILI